MIDKFLQMLVSTANDTQGDTAISVTVKGLVISGRLAPIDDYLEWLGKMLGTDLGPSLDASVPKADIEAIAESLPPIEYIHLRDVRVRSGNQVTVLANAWWRGKLEEVDGFIIGEWQDSSPE